MGIRFQSIRISGYRGRHFELNMINDEKHSVFVLDGNTGKTTTIELLRWCFRLKESEAKGKFKHMWADPAHILDYAIEGQQECVIQVQFEDNEGRHYKFERTTIGSHDRSKSREPSCGDKIKSIKDTLEIDRGAEVIQGDDVNEYLASRFKLRNSADYFCFDGERAREMIRMATSQVQKLISLVRQRTTHAQVQSYLDSLDELKDDLLLEADATLTDRAQKRTENKLKTKKFELHSHAATISGLEDEEAVFQTEIEKLEGEMAMLTDQIRLAESETIRQRANLEHSRTNKKKEMAQLREAVYHNCKVWMELDLHDVINEVKDYIRERGRLPEPYREDLIIECLKDPPTCKICGRPLDNKESLERVKQLGVQIAPHQTQKFLTSKMISEGTSFDIPKTRKKIHSLVKELTEIESEYSLIALSKEDEALFHEKTERSKLHFDFQQKLGQTQQKLEDARDYYKILEHELEQFIRKSAVFQKNKPMLEAIEKLEMDLESAHDKMRTRTIEVIGEVISKAASSILGGRFSAVLTEEDGLMLGEDGYFNPEIGGYSGRLILSYLFAEAMSQVNPIIIDTPVGNVGSHRAALAKHLANNHTQTILLCLPTELGEFAEHFVDKKNHQLITNQ